MVTLPYNALAQDGTFLTRCAHVGLTLTCSVIDDLIVLKFKWKYKNLSRP